MDESRAPVRVYLTGRVRVEAGPILVDDADLPGRQGRLLLAMLVAERDRAVSRDELAQELWADHPPAAWELGLRALLSRLRRTLEQAGLGADVLRHAFGAYQVHLPGDAWVDVDAASDAVHHAELALAADDPGEAWGWAYVGYHICRRPFLVGEDGAWVTGFRQRLDGLRLRALDCVVECNSAVGDLAEAARAAEDALALDPLREATYRLYMRALVAGGDRVEALRVWERCRRVLADELGISPSPRTEAVYLDVVRE